MHDILARIGTALDKPERTMGPSHHVWLAFADVAVR